MPGAFFIFYSCAIAISPDFRYISIEALREKIMSTVTVAIDNELLAYAREYVRYPSDQDLVRAAFATLMRGIEYIKCAPQQLSQNAITAERDPGQVMPATTVQIDDEILNAARSHLGPVGNGELAQLAIVTFIRRKAGKWLAAQGGTQPNLDGYPDEMRDNQ